MEFGIRGQLIDVITCVIFSRLVQGLRSSDTPELPFPIDLCRPYNSVRTGALRSAKLQSNHHEQTNTQLSLQAGCTFCRPTKCQSTEGKQ